MELIVFQLKGYFAHFLRAEASASALSYPIPPRTVILGMLGAVLGLPKDKPQVVLEPASIAIRGRVPKTHWHRVKLRKDPPAPLPRVIKKTQKVDKKKITPEKAALILQEWLFKPDYTVWVSVPELYNRQLKERLEQRRWYFTPSLGLSEMMADIEYLGLNGCSPLPKGTYDIQSVFPQDAGALDMEQIFKKKLAIHSLQMPRSLTPDRVFSHCAYFVERDAKPVPVNTKQAYKVEDKVLMFL
ncbi:CRISPR-associated protein Cas5 [candidate division NPL-UPA2 bacterium]|nr:CRISPR-associated protein Cas5 [candidate division NPL-UPA2 bacterium]